MSLLIYTIEGTFLYILLLITSSFWFLLIGPSFANRSALTQQTCLTPPSLFILCLLLQLYWVSPLTYAQQGLFLNEFTDSRWDTLISFNGQSMRLGDAILSSRNLWTDRWADEAELLIIFSLQLLKAGLFTITRVRHPLFLIAVAWSGFLPSSSSDTGSCLMSWWHSF